MPTPPSQPGSTSQDPGAGLSSSPPCHLCEHAPCNCDEQGPTLERLILGHLEAHGETEENDLYDAIDALYQRSQMRMPLRLFESTLWRLVQGKRVRLRHGKWEDEAFYRLRPQAKPGAQRKLFEDERWSDWHGSYDVGWKSTGLLVDEAYSHPAKFAYGLITRIVAHGLAEGYWHPGGEVEVTPEVQAQIVADLAGGQGGVDAIVTSPPYADAGGTPSLGSVNKDNWGHEGRDICGRRKLSASYGHAPGQIGQLKSGDLDDVLDG